MTAPTALQVAQINNALAAVEAIDPMRGQVHRELVRDQYRARTLTAGNADEVAATIWGCARTLGEERVAREAHGLRRALVTR